MENEKRKELMDDFIQFHHNPIVAQKNKEIADLEAEVKRLRDGMQRLDIECQGTSCDCGSELKDWDIAILVKKLLTPTKTVKEGE